MLDWRAREVLPLTNALSAKVATNAEGVATNAAGVAS